MSEQVKDNGKIVAILASILLSGGIGGFGGHTTATNQMELMMAREQEKRFALEQRVATVESSKPAVMASQIETLKSQMETLSGDLKETNKLLREFANSRR